MADLKLTDVGKTYGGNVEVLKHVDLDIAKGELIVFVGPSGCGQVHASADDRGTRTDHPWHADDRRGDRQRRAALRAGHRDGVPVLRALSPHDRARQHGLRPPDRQGSQGQDRRAGRRSGEEAAADRVSRPSAEGAVGRTAAARRDRPVHRARPQGLSLRRAALESRRRASRGDADPDRAAQGADARLDHDLRDARPGRGHDPRVPHRRAQRTEGTPTATSAWRRSDRRWSCTRRRTPNSSPSSSARRR